MCKHKRKTIQFQYVQDNKSHKHTNESHKKHRSYGMHILYTFCRTVKLCQRRFAFAVVLLGVTIDIGRQWRCHLGIYSLRVRGDGSLQTLFTDFDCKSDQNWKSSHNLPPDS